MEEIWTKAGVCDCCLEQGMVRCDVNVSVKPKGQQELGAKILIKNMNSFSGVRKALEYEIPRQFAAFLQHVDLTRNLIFERLSNTAEAVHVLYLNFSAKFLLAARAHADIHVAAD